MSIRRISQTIFLALWISLPLCAQSPTPTKPAIPSSEAARAELESKLMGRKMPYHVVLPPFYNSKEEAGRRYPVVYLLHGLTGHFDNWASRTNVEEQSRIYSVIIIMPEGENGWYTDHTSKDGAMFESYVIRELIPAVDRAYRTWAGREKRAIAGLSMGGFGAVKFGLKYPDLFGIVGSFSGALGITAITEKQFPGAVGRTVEQIFGPPDSPIRKANDPFNIVREATPEKIKTWPFIYLDCGTEDFLFKQNREFADLLYEKSVPHEYRQLPGGHNWKYWDVQVQDFMRTAARTFAGR